MSVQLSLVIPNTVIQVSFGTHHLSGTTIGYLRNKTNTKNWPQVQGFVTANQQPIGPNAVFLTFRRGVMYTGSNLPRPAADFWLDVHNLQLNITAAISAFS